MKKQIALVLLLLASVGLAAGCGGDDETSGQTNAAASSSVPFDRAFIDAMVPHHRSAIEMAEAAKEAGLSQPDLVEVADNIVVTQQAEIDQMLAWRADWFGSSEIDPKGAETLGLSESQMGMQHDVSDLSSADDVDQAFAEMMIGHHEGAVTMASLAQDRGQHEEVKELAGRIIEAQQAEIEVLKVHAEGEHHS